MAFEFLFQHSSLAAKGLEYLLVARTAAKAVSLLRAAIIGHAGLVIGLRSLAGLSAGTAAKVAILEGCTKISNCCYARLQTCTGICRLALLV